jgi:carbamoyltransferase
MMLDSLGVYNFMIGTKGGVNFSQNVIEVYQKLRKKTLRIYLESLLGVKNIEFFDHHECHIASSCLISYSNLHKVDGIALSMDASGEGWCSKSYKLSDGELKEFKYLRIPSLFSPANLYMNVTSLLGFKALRHEGKVTGLAAYGNGEQVAALIRPLFNYNSLNQNWFNFMGYRAKQLYSLKKIFANFASRDIAAGVQLIVEDILIKYLETEIAPIGGGSHIFLSGGLFANVKLNQKIAESGIFSGVTVAPNMGDGGLNLGAAALSSRKSSEFPKYQFIAKNLSLGYMIGKSEVENAVKESGLRFRNVFNQKLQIANRLAEGKVVAIACGRMEYGPRALGNRSILFPATDKYINDWLNKRLKRNEFMPFAPIVLERNASKHFEIQDNSDYSNMTITVRVKSQTRIKYPAIVHIDQTARPQIVSDWSNLLYGVLMEYQKLTGLEILGNTSFNMHEEPLVRTAKEAIKAFKVSGLDFLFLPEFEISADD